MVQEKYCILLRWQITLETHKLASWECAPNEPVWKVNKIIIGYKQPLASYMSTYKMRLKLMHSANFDWEKF